MTAVHVQQASLLPALPVNEKALTSRDVDSDSDGVECKVEDLVIHSPISPPSTHHNTAPSSDPQQSNSKTRGFPTPLQTQALENKSGPPSARSFVQSPVSATDSNPSPRAEYQPLQPWALNATASPRVGPLLTPAGACSPALSAHRLVPQASHSLPLPGMLTPSSRKGSVASLSALPRASPGFRGAPLGQTSDTESVLKQFDVYHGKVYLTGQLQKKNDLGVDGSKLHGEQWAAYHAELIGSKLRLKPMIGSSGPRGQEEEINVEEAAVEMLDGSNGGTFTVAWMGANRAIFQPVQKVSLGAPEVGSTCHDWVCAIRLSCYECSRLQEIYTSTLLRKPKFRDQVAGTIEGPIKAEGMLRVKFWAGEDWQQLYVVVSDQRGEDIKKKKQGKILQGGAVRGQVHFYESPGAKKPFISMFNVSQAYAVCPTRSSISASKLIKADEEGSLTIKFEGDVVLQRENLAPPRKGFFSAPPAPSPLAKELEALMPSGRSMFCMIQVADAAERTKFLLGASEAFRIYGKPGPLMFDSPTDPSAMNFGCMASSLLQQELLLGLDAVIHLPQKGESLADVKFSFSEVLRKRLVAENPPQRRLSGHFGPRRHSTMPHGADVVGVPSPMMVMAMRARANSGSGFLVPQPSPSLRPTHMSAWNGATYSPQLTPYGMTNSPRQGPMHMSPHMAPYGAHRLSYAASTISDDNDANLATDEEGEDEEYPDTPEDDDENPTIPIRSRPNSTLMAPPPLGHAQVRKGSVHSMHSMQSMQSMNGGRAGRSDSFTSAFGVQMPPEGPKKKNSVLELPSLDPFSENFAVKEDESMKQKKLTAVVYPAQQVVIPKNKRQNSTPPTEQKACQPVEDNN
ncbi:MAG: hypothetical protein J3Q66DRAFT_190417 [Benniella sp.]|nr:MAG: hypothetical protein J3Q66DRAFT_190417 [Benniella sp.]